jgi:DNA repair protein RadC
MTTLDYSPSPGLLRPREKLAAHGSQRLSDLDLIQLLLGSGCRQVPLEALAQRCRDLLDRHGTNLQFLHLEGIPGLGLAKAGQLIAALELARRLGRPAHLRISGPADLVPRLRHWTDRPQEIFLTVTLNGAQEILDIRPVTVGLLNRTLIHPREVFAPALEERAASLILAHTHPSGSLEPSREDREATTRLSQAGKLLGVEVLDHLIVTAADYYSFRENGEGFL